MLPLSLQEICQLPQNNSQTIVTDLFSKILDEDGYYIIYLYQIRRVGDEIDRRFFHHTLAVIKDQQKIIFFCPLHGFVEINSPTSIIDFQRWINTESQAGNMAYFSNANPTNTLYVEAAKLPLSQPSETLAISMPHKYCSHLPCVKRTSKKCSKCKSVQYCSIDCQKAHWPLHKAQCHSATAK